MDANMFDDLGSALIVLFIIGIVLAIGAWELFKWLISFIDISISFK